jgi:hypothetical protein
VKSPNENDENFRRMFKTVDKLVAVYEAVDNGQNFIPTYFNVARERIENVNRAAIVGRRVITFLAGVEEFSPLRVIKRV